ncbi:hypothetical protein Acr_21g0003390 [Actinidia rufa]|uniref:Uncharacterized protein n=1 Tax=Actinidia rufa TaxID=165716 RepID=A0A7J0GFY9_9ERIC|nr:hypothetical protein Acr_21g0003390 [Actinidia rufa]
MPIFSLFLLGPQAIGVNWQILQTLTKPPKETLDAAATTHGRSLATANDFSSYMSSSDSNPGLFESTYSFLSNVSIDSDFALSDSKPSNDDSPCLKTTKKIGAWHLEVFVDISTII